MKKNLMVIFGGRSTEHDISIITANQLMNAVSKTKYNLFPVYITNNGAWLCGDVLLDIKFYGNFNAKKLKKVAVLPCSNKLYVKHLSKFKELAKIDCAIISCHGKNGEDGSLQGLLELSQIPYQSSGILGSAIGLDKSVMKQIFKQNKIPIVDYVEILKTKFETDEKLLKKIMQKISFPVVVKPNSLGSSIGISVCKTEDELKNALSLAFAFDSKVLVEKCVENLKEVNISVLGYKNQILLSETEEVLNSGFLSFDKKYMQNGSKNAQKQQKDAQICPKNEKNQYSKIYGLNQNLKNGMQNMGRIIPANVTQTQCNQIKKFAKTIFEATDSKGVIRIDFMLDQKTGKVYANEINTIPGSFAFYLWEKSGINFSELVDKLVQIAESDAIEKSKLTTTFVSSVLSQNAVEFKK